MPSQYLTLDDWRLRAEKLERRAAWYDARGNAYMASEMRRRAANKRRFIESHEQLWKKVYND